MNENINNAAVQEEGMDLREILRALVDKIFWIIGAVVLCAALTFVYTKMTFVPSQKDQTLRQSPGTFCQAARSGRR